MAEENNSKGKKVGIVALAAIRRKKRLAVIVMHNTKASAPVV